MKKAIVQSVLVVLLVCGAASSVLADTHYAAQNGQTPSGTFTDWNSAASNIQDAVNAATTNDTVLVGAGHYTTNALAGNVVNITKPLSLLSSNGIPASVSIDGSGANRGIYVSGAATNQLLIDGFTVSNCWATSGSGLYVTFSGTAVVQNCVVSDNIQGNAGGIGVSMVGGIMISNCVVRHNMSTNSGSTGGGIYQYNGKTLITDCLIESNSAYDGGGIWTHIDAPAPGALVRNCTIRGNRARPVAGSLSYASGGGIWFYPASNQTVTVRNCLIYNKRGYPCNANAPYRLCFLSTICR